MKPREIASAFGYAKPYFYNYWKFNRVHTADITPSMRDSGSIFIHIPKTAGMSIHRTIYDRDTGHGHAPAYGFRKRNPQEYDKLFTFTIMREPTDRFISAFYYLKTAPINDRDEKWGKDHLAGYQGPNELLTAIRENRWVRGEMLSWVHFTPQAWFINDQAGNQMVEYIGRLEEFDRHMSEIATRLGRDFTPKQVNKSKRPRETPLDDANLALLHDFYAEDYELYDKLFGTN
ncbi:sulfotransferase family 2 domain-containing protein [Celeribacter sp. SCSIO 80788]|uniref:sulfotransferase family 2 domain-containing protein n=1 Tax=Celeribacter sp. SCSIO 80788 TaxID=3117013 RepID=UPI003DA6CC9B